MRRLIAVVLAGSTIVAGFAARAETVTVQAGSFGDFRQLLSRQAPSGDEKFEVTLSFPPEAHARYPAVVIVHTLGGYIEGNEGWHAAQLREAGFATLTYSSPAARRLRDGNVAGVWPSGVAEAYAALQLLAHHPRVDPERIAIVGFSFGGEIAHVTAFERMRAALVTGPTHFAAHVAYYPAGVHGAAAEPGAYTAAPMLMLLGEKDDNLPVAKARDYFAYLAAGGAAPSVETRTYASAYHAWTVPSLGAPQFYPQYRSTRKCPYMLLGAGRPAVLVDGRAGPLDPAAWQACLNEGQGYSMAFDAPTRTRSMHDTAQFLRKVLRP